MIRIIFIIAMLYCDAATFCRRRNDAGIMTDETGRRCAQESIDIIIMKNKYYYLFIKNNFDYLLKDKLHVKSSLGQWSLVIIAIDAFRRCEIMLCILGAQEYTIFPIFPSLLEKDYIESYHTNPMHLVIMTECIHYRFGIWDTVRSVQPHKILETFYFCVQKVDVESIEFINFIFNPFKRQCREKDKTIRMLWKRFLI